MDIKPGCSITVEHTTGQATGRPKTETASGIVYLDDEGVLRVDGPTRAVNLSRDAEGYFRPGVVVVSVRPAQPAPRKVTTTLTAPGERAVKVDGQYIGLITREKEGWMSTGNRHAFVTFTQAARYLAYRKGY